MNLTVSQALLQLASLVDEYLLGWVLASVAVGFLVPSIAVLTVFSTPILAVMIGSISLTLTVEQFRAIRGRALGTIILVQASMPFVAFGLAQLLGASPALTAGFVILGAVTPELVTPVMTQLSGGDTALSATALVVIGLGTVGYIPVVVALLLAGTVSVDQWAIITELVFAVVLPMLVVIGVRWRWPTRISQYEEYYPSVSALMVILIIGIVTAANAAVIRSAGPTLVVVGVGAVVLNGYGYTAGWLAGRQFSRAEQIATTLSVGMRDFAVAAALLVAAGFPTAATLPAILFGIIEMSSSAGLARIFSDDS
jgi:BASS family bile acid:Na+ symporter